MNAGLLTVAAVTILALNGQSQQESEQLSFELPDTDGKTVTLIEKRSTVLDRRYRDGEVEMTVRIGRRQVDELLAGGARIRINGMRAQEALQQEWRIGESPQPSMPRPVPPHKQ